MKVQESRGLQRLRWLAGRCACAATGAAALCSGMPALLPPTKQCPTDPPVSSGPRLPAASRFAFLPCRRPGPPSSAAGEAAILRLSSHPIQPSKTKGAEFHNRCTADPHIGRNGSRWKAWLLPPPPSSSTETSLPSCLTTCAPLYRNQGQTKRLRNAPSSSSSSSESSMPSCSACVWRHDFSALACSDTGAVDVLGVGHANATEYSRGREPWLPMIPGQVMAWCGTPAGTPSGDKCGSYRHQTSWTP